MKIYIIDELCFLLAYVYGGWFYEGLGAQGPWNANVEATLNNPIIVGTCNFLEPMLILTTRIIVDYNNSQPMLKF